ncbi:MAG: hypothetical protein NTW21_04560, partial [Verrucomicrobia bacterium]|nr:hypothetical protein [Verrucomicrobiota bacterium]
MNVGTGRNHSVLEMPAAATSWDTDRGSKIVDERAHSSSAIHNPPSAIRYPPSTIHYPLSTIHYPL